MKIRIGTRGSALARVQAADVARRITAAGHAAEIVIIATLGDRVSDRTFSDVGAFGIFVREIESALLDRAIDVAVHSYKDLPSKGPGELVVAAVPERLDAADILLVRAVASTSEGPIPVRYGARVGTSAARRRALLIAARPDLDVGMLRGNVPTRVRALIDGQFDAIVLAAAGLSRLQRNDDSERLVFPSEISCTRLDPTQFVPAPAQGAIALQVRANDEAVREVVAALNDPTTERALRAERMALALADGGCTLPFGAWCEVQGDGSLILWAALGLDDGTVARSRSAGDDPSAIAGAAWRELTAVASK
jgi:hydroxymethylbilane synthase